MEKPLFILITRQLNDSVESKLRSLIAGKIDAYVMCDEEPTKKSKRILYIPDSDMEKLGWTHHMSQKVNKVTAWDKATYFAYTSKKKYVWLCEDDVYWNKPSVIRHIVNFDSDADLIANPLAPSFTETPKWYHWDKVDLLTHKKKYWMATYNQLCRLSDRVLKSMYDLSVQRKRLFFHEGMFATICNMYGYKIEMIEDPDVFINFRWKPDWTLEELRDVMYVLVHPVKTKSPQ
jgi:hypothetical protein